VSIDFDFKYGLYKYYRVDSRNHHTIIDYEEYVSYDGAKLQALIPEVYEDRTLTGVSIVDLKTNKIVFNKIYEREPD